MKICTRCRKEKDVSEFNKNKSKSDGLCRVCKECNKELLKDHYQRNKEYYLERNRRRKRERKEYIRSFKTRCEICGEDHIACLDFHHPQEDKEFTICTSMYMSKEKLKEEIDKCICLCSNCHRKLHWKKG